MQKHDELITAVRADLNAKKGYTKRRIIDLLTGLGIKAGGVGVVFAVVLIFFYLISVVLPLFESAELKLIDSQGGLLTSVETTDKVADLLDPSNSRYFATEEYGEVLTNITSSGEIQFFYTGGEFISETKLELAENETIKQVQPISAKDNWIAIVSSEGNLFIVEQHYQLQYPDNKRLVIPSIRTPFGNDSIPLSTSVEHQYSIFINDETLVAGYVSVDNSVQIDRFNIEQNFLDESLSLEKDIALVISNQHDIAGLMVANDGRWLYQAGVNGEVKFYQISQNQITLVASQTADKEISFTTVAPLLGNYSMLVGDSDGNISQWFGYRKKESNKLQLVNVRSFSINGLPIKKIIPEQQRKGFLALDEDNTVGVFFTTSEKTLLKQKLGNNLQAFAINGSSERLIGIDNSQIIEYQLTNEHPEISFSSLWNKVWYESYSEPDHVWQSSASSNDFESKFSLAPLTYGTLKAAFYALIFAIPLALFGAIYTAFFMSPKLRSTVKPTIEIMEALPTVILGFLAGLWLAPFIEQHLSGVLLFLISTPLITLAAGFAYHSLPKQFRNFIPEGWRPILLIPIIALIAFVTTHYSVSVEAYLFDGNARVWMRDELGITFDQRNALVVGIAMGFAVIPTIFSIAEDALFSVPKHLVAGSLALGANPWQTLVKVVLPTASPGIFSGVMIGMGRAVGETMIVLMATGNTPIMNMNIFEGMRTLAANIAVEMPEAELASSHYRILFLAALVLFGFTFVANTIAEIIRHRLRKKYSSL